MTFPLDLRDGREVCVWAFDRLYLDAKDVRRLPLVERKALLTRLVHRTSDSCLQLSESFDDGAKLLAAAEKTGLGSAVMRLTDPAPVRLDQGQDPGLARGQQRALAAV